MTNQKITKKIERIIVLAMVFFVLNLIIKPAISQADITPYIHYQGKLNDNEGNPVKDRSYQMTFSLYTSSGESSSFWQESKKVETKNGVFSALLSVDPDEVLFDDDNYYLGIKVEGDSEMKPRKRITAVPQAYNANNLSGTGYINIKGNPIGTSPKDATVYINPSSASGTQPVLAITVGGSNKLIIYGNGNLETQGDVIADKFEGDGADIENIDPENIDQGTADIDIEGNAETVTYGIYTNENYEDPTWLTTLSVSKITGTLPVIKGGTGLTSIADGSILYSSATNTLAALTGLTGDDGQYLRFNWNGGNPTLSWEAGGGSGNFDSFIAAGDSGGGQTISDGNTLTIVGGTNLTSIDSVADTVTINLDSILSGVTWNGTAIGATYGGTGINSSASTGVAIVSTGTWSIASTLNHERGGLEVDASAFNGLIKISAGTTTTITDNSTNWNTAYTHSQLTTGNPHSVTKSDVGLGSVENTALSTWAGSTNITTLGTITTGVWNGTAIGVTRGGTGTTTQFTPGSIVFAGASGVYSQDNANFFWDDTSNRLGIGTASPATNLEITGALRLSTTGTDSFITPQGTSVPTKINIPLFNPGNYGSIMIAGLPAASEVTARAFTFVDARAGVHQQTLGVFSPGESDIFGFSWDGSETTAYLKTLASNFAFRVNTTNIMTLLNSGKVGIGDDNPATGGLVVASGVTIGSDNSDNLIDDASNGAGSATLYIGNQSILTSGWAGSTNITTLGTITTGVWNGTEIGVTKGGTGTTTQFAPGSIVFAGASGVYSQDNANFFWDDTSNRLGIGTNTPTAFLDLPAATTVASSLRIQSGSAPISPNVGDIYSNGTDLMYYNGSMWDDLTASAGSSKWTDAGAITYLTSQTDDLAVGGTTSAAALFFDEGAEWLKIGSTGAQSGQLRLENNQYITFRDAANAADINFVRLNTDNEIEFGATEYNFVNNTTAINFHTYKSNGDTTLSFINDYSAYQMNITLDGTLTAGTADLAAPSIAIANDTAISGRNNADSAYIDIFRINDSDEVEFDASEYRMQNNTTNFNFHTYKSNGHSTINFINDYSGYGFIVASDRAVAIGDDPADYGAVRLSNDEWIASEAAIPGTDINMFRINTSDNIEIGKSVLEFYNQTVDVYLQGYRATTLVYYFQNTHSSYRASVDIEGALAAHALGSGTGTNLIIDGSGNILAESSSLKYKENIKDLNIDTEKLFNLRPVSFTWKEQQKKDFGLVAEETYEILPELVNLDNEGKPESIKYSHISVLLLNEVKKQKDKIKALSLGLGVDNDTSNNIIDIEDAIDEINEQMNEIKSMINEQGTVNNIAINEEQIEANKQNIALIYQLLGIKEKSSDIAISGKLTAEEIEVGGVKTGQIIISVSDEKSPTVGTEKISEGKTKFIVETRAIKDDSKIFVTLKKSNKAVPIQVSRINESESFEVEIGEELSGEVEFDWWIIEKE